MIYFTQKLVYKTFFAMLICDFSKFILEKTCSVSCVSKKKNQAIHPAQYSIRH